MKFLTLKGYNFSHINKRKRKGKFFYPLDSPHVDTHMQIQEIRIQSKQTWQMLHADCRVQIFFLTTVINENV